MPPSLKRAILFGLISVLTETIAFFTWEITGWNGWERAWLWILGWVIVCFLGGAVSLLQYFRNPVRRMILGPALAIGLLLISFPLGGLYLWGAIQILTGYTVEIVNQSAQPIESFQIQVPGLGNLEAGPIRPGATVCKHFRLTGEGRLTVSAIQGMRKQSAVLDASGSDSAGGHKIVVIDADGHCEVRSAPHP